MCRAVMIIGNVNYKLMLGDQASYFHENPSVVSEVISGIQYMYKTRIH
jgi:hypothetical protein